jgi:hypothetical protein
MDTRVEIVRTTKTMENRHVTRNINIKVVRDDELVLFDRDYPEGTLNWADLEHILHASGMRVEVKGRDPLRWWSKKGYDGAYDTGNNKDNDIDYDAD